jgi:hypothetical protein
MLTLLLWLFSDLNALVADYLFTEGFKSAAENFSREAGISPPIDLDSLESRMQIRRAVQRGDVESATEMVNELDPEVSSPSLVRRTRHSSLARG